LLTSRPIIRLAFPLALVLAASVAAPRLAAADDKAEAGRHFKLGVGLYGERKFDEALVEFQRAYDLAPHPSVLYNIAVTYRELSRYNESIVYFERFLTEGEKAVKKKLIQQAKKELDELRARVGSVEVSVKPDDTLISVDGREVGPTPLSSAVVLGPGEHKFELKAPWGAVEQRTVTVTAGDTSKLTAELVKPPDPPPPDRNPDGNPDRITDTVIRKPVTLPPRRRASVSAAMATNALHAGDTGAPLLGLSVALGSRVSFGVDVVLVAWAAVPSIRLGLLPNRAVYAVVAVPIAFTDGDETKTFVAGAGGLGASLWVAPKIAIRAEALVSFAGETHGLTVPVSIGAELWF
jgi:hypothetical protein